MYVIGREMETLRKNQKEMLGIKNTGTEAKNVFDGLISRLDIAEERISKLENRSIEIPLWNAERRKNEKKQNI